MMVSLLWSLLVNQLIVLTSIKKTIKHYPAFLYELYLRVNKYLAMGKFFIKEV